MLTNQIGLIYITAGTYIYIYFFYIYEQIEHELFNLFKTHKCEQIINWLTLWMQWDIYISIRGPRIWQLTGIFLVLLMANLSLSPMHH